MEVNEQEYQDSIEECQDLSDRLQKSLKKVTRILSYLESIEDIVNCLNKNNAAISKSLALINKKLENEEELFKRVVDKLDSVDITLENVLLAINQNEYLQAWYPAQQGHPAQKVVGKWPNK